MIYWQAQAQAQIQPLFPWVFNYPISILGGMPLAKIKTYPLNLHLTILGEKQMVSLHPAPGFLVRP